MGNRSLLGAFSRSLLYAGNHGSFAASQVRRVHLHVERAVVVETPQLGHATYAFSKPRNMETFLALYAKVTKDDIRCNRDNVGERLGFLGRIIHGTNPLAWLKEIRQRMGEKIDFASAVAD